MVEPLLDRELVVMAAVEREFGRSVLHDDFAVIAQYLPEFDSGDFGAADLVNLAGLVIEGRRLRAAVPASDLQVWESLRVGPYAVVAAAMCVLAVANDPEPDPAARELLRDAARVLERARGGLCYLNGAGCLGPVDAYLEFAHARRGEEAPARRYRDSAVALTATFARAWAGWSPSATGGRHDR